MIYFIGTAIGNTQDTTYRAAKTLTEADYIYAEDTRTFVPYYKKIQSLFALSAKQPQKIMSLHTDNEFEKVSEVVLHAQKGLTCALVSESGMPIVSDPGALVLQEIIKNGLEYTVIPGPSALTTSIVLSGFSAKQVLFLSFLPKKESHSRLLFTSIAQSITKAYCPTIIFYESPHRIYKTIAILDSFTRPSIKEMAICREMTKKFEEVIRGTPDQLKNMTFKGEMTVVARFDQSV